MRDSGVMVLSQVGVTMVSTGTSVILARSLSRKTFGEFGGFLGLSQALSLAVDLGLASWLLRELSTAWAAEDNGRAVAMSAALLRSALRVNLRFGAVLVAATAGIGIAVELRGDLVALATSLVSYVTLIAMSAVLEAGLRARRQLRRIVYANVVEKVLLITLVAAALILKTGLWGVAAAYPVAGFARLASEYRPALGGGKLTSAHAKISARTILRSSAPFAVNAAAFTFLPRLDVPIVALISASSAASFALGWQIFTTIALVPVIGGATLYPFIARHLGTVSLTRVAMGFAACGVVVAAVAIGLVPTLVPFVFGAKYHRAVPVIQVILLSVPFLFYGNGLMVAAYFGRRETALAKAIVPASVIGSAAVLGGQLAFGAIGAGGGFVIRYILFVLTLLFFARATKLPMETAVEQSEVADDGATGSMLADGGRIQTPLPVIVPKQDVATSALHRVMPPAWGEARRASAKRTTARTPTTFRQPRLIGVACLAVAMALVVGAGVSLGAAPLAAVPPLAILGGLLIWEPRNRVLFVVFGALLALQSSSGVSVVKVAYAAGLVACGLCSASAYMRISDSARELVVPLLRMSAVILVAVMVGALVGLSYHHSVSAMARDGLTYLLLAYVPLFVIDLSLCGARFATNALVTVGALATLVFVLNWLSRRGFAQTSTIGLSSFVLAAIAFVYCFVRGQSKLRWMASSGVFLVAMFATGTRSSLFFLLGPALTMILPHAESRRRIGRGVLALLALGLCTVVAFEVGVISTASVDRLTGGNGDLASAYSVGARLGLNRSVSRLITEAPVLGHGLGTTFSYTNAFSQDQVNNVPTADTVLTTAARFGVIGLIVFVALAVAVASLPWRRGRRDAAALSGMGLLPVLAAYAVVASPLEDKGLALGLMLLIGASAATPQGSSHADDGGGLTSGLAIPRESGPRAHNRGPSPGDPGTEPALAPGEHVVRHQSPRPGRERWM